MLWTSAIVNVGMWLERYLIIVPGLAFKQPLTFTWQDYAPRLPEYIITAASFGVVALGFLTFAKLFPIIPLHDIKEGHLLRTELGVGHRRMPAVLRE
jgi:hypothetical protein